MIADGNPQIIGEFSNTQIIRPSDISQTSTDQTKEWI